MYKNTRYNNQMKYECKIILMAMNKTVMKYKYIIQLHYMKTQEKNSGPVAINKKLYEYNNIIIQ